MKKFIVIICCFITVFLSSAPQKNKKVITFKADIASYQEVKAKNVFKGQGNAYLEIDNYKILVLFSFLSPYICTTGILCYCLMKYS